MMVITPGETVYTPLELEYGEAALLDTRNMQHGNMINKEKYARVSFDGRVIPLSKYRPSHKESIAYGLQFKRGSYYAQDLIEP